MRIIFAFTFYLLYWFICFLATGNDRKNLIGLRSYPDSVQERVRAQGLADNLRKPSIPSIFIGNILLFTAVFSLIGLIFRRLLQLDSYLSSFLFFLALGEGLSLFDLVVIDLLWRRNTSRIRFSFIPEKSAYWDPGKHLGSFWREIPVFAAVAALSAAVTTIL